MKRLTCCVAALLLGGCANSITTGTSQLSRELVARRLVNGKTTKAEVRALLGEPQSTAISDLGGSRFAEVWTYTKTFYRDAAEKGVGYAIAYGMLNPLRERLRSS